MENETLVQKAEKLVAEKLEERKVRAIATRLDEKQYLNEKIARIDKEIENISNGKLMADDCERGERRY